MKPATALLTLIAAAAGCASSSANAAALAPARLDGLVVQAARPGAPVVVQLMPLHDAGGLSAVSATGDTINISYTEAIRRYLTDVGYTVIDKAPKNGTPAYSVEGDLSHLSVDDAGNGPYLCVLRLFAENGRHKLVGQWAGVAQNLRYLTANLNETEGVDSEGLLGEMGGKIAETIRATSDKTGAATFSAIVDVASQPVLIDAFPITIDDKPSTPAIPSTAKVGQPEPFTPDQLVSGQPYRLQIRSMESGKLTLIAIGPTGEPLALSTSGGAADIDIAADKPVVVPATGQLTAPAATAPEYLRIVVLERLTSTAPTYFAPDNELPARVLLGTTPPASPAVSDPAVANLLRTILADPPHTWAARAIILHIVPR